MKIYSNREFLFLFYRVQSCRLICFLFWCFSFQVLKGFKA